MILMQTFYVRLVLLSSRSQEFLPGRSRILAFLIQPSSLLWRLIFRVSRSGDSVFFCSAATFLPWVWHCWGPTHLTPAQDAVIPFQASQTKKTTGYCFPHHIIRKNWPSFIQFPHLGTWNVSLFNQDFRFFRKLNFSSGPWAFLDLYFFSCYFWMFFLSLFLKNNIVGVICH